MSLLLLAVVVCTNCCDTGYIEVPCASCRGSGLVVDNRVRKANRQNLSRLGSANKCCRDCCKGMYNPKSVGLGKVKKVCPICKGKKNKKRP